MNEWKTTFWMFVMTWIVLLSTMFMLHDLIALLVMAIVMGYISLAMKASARKSNNKPAFKSPTHRDASVMQVLINAVIFAGGIVLVTATWLSHSTKPLFFNVPGVTLPVPNTDLILGYLFAYFLVYVLAATVIAWLLAWLFHRKKKTEHLAAAVMP